MKPLKLTSILTMLVVMLAIVVVSTGQGQDLKEGSKRTPTDVVKPEATPTGWLILNGKLIPGPYDIVIEDGKIKINGLGIAPSPKPRKVITVEPNTAAQHQVFVAFREAFNMWVAEEGLEIARQRALEFMQAQPIVEKAYLASESDLRVLFRGEKYEERVYLHPPRKSPLSPEEVRQQFLEDRVESLRYWLTHGTLVILNEGVLMATPPAEGEATLKKLQEIVATKADVDERLSAIREIIPDKEMAKAIAERLSQE